MSIIDKGKVSGFLNPAFKPLKKIGESIASSFETAESLVKGAGREGIFYLFLFFGSLAFFVPLNLDTEGLRIRLENFLSARSGLDISTRKLGLTFPPGLKLTGVTVGHSSTETKIGVDALKVRALLLPLLALKPGLKIYAEEADGNLAINLTGGFNRDSKLNVSINANKFPIDKAIEKIYGMPVPISGALTLDGNFNLAPKDLNSAEGEIRLSVSKIVFSKTGFGDSLLKKLEPEEAACELSLSKGVLNAKKCGAKSELGEAELRISTRLANPIANTALSGFLIIKNPSGIIGSLLGMYPKLKRPDGAYHIPLRGTFARPSLGL